MKAIKQELCRNRHQERVQEHVQVDESPDGAQQLSSVQLDGDDFLSSALLLLPSDQQLQRGDNVHVDPERETEQEGMGPNVGPQQMHQGWEAPEVTVQVQPQKLSQGREFPEVTVQVRPQKPSQRWEALSVTVQVELKKWGQGRALPQVTVQVQPQEQGQGMAGIKVTVRLGCDPEEVTRLQDQGEEVLGNGDQLPSKLNQGVPVAKSEGERELAVGEMMLQGSMSQKEDQEGEVTKCQQDHSQKGKRTGVELQEIQARDKADLDGMRAEGQLQDQSKEQEQLKADLPLQKEGKTAMEMRQDKGNIQEGTKQMVVDEKKHLGKEVVKRPRETPNYFVAIPITDDQILDRIEDVQELIFTKEPDLLRAFIPVQTMHLTIIVAHLGTEEEVKKAILALKQSKTKVQAILQGKDFNMTFQGIGQFNNQVIYVKMLEEDQKMLSRIADAVEECFTKMNLDISGSKDFKPHLSFLKLSKAPRWKRRNFRRICADLYKEYEDSYFGTQIFSHIDLCAMHKKKQESGYYYCECSINMGFSDMEESKEYEMQTEDVGETITEEHPNSAADAEIGACLAASCKLGSCLVVAEDRPSQKTAEASIASKEKETDEVKGQPETTDGTFLAAGEICSKPVLGLLPASSDEMKSMEKEQEAAKITDGSLQKTEAMEYAPDQPTCSG